ncbi:MAG: thioredoxin domain-containing protein [Betaproteobacteria bacterium]
MGLGLRDLGFGVAVFAIACSTTVAGPQSAAGGGAEVAATVGDASITLAEVDKDALQQPVSNFGASRLSQALYDARRSTLDALIANALLDREAKARGLGRDALVQQEIVAKTKPPTDEEVEAWYRANEARLRGAALEQVRAPIRQLLTRQRTAQAREAYVAQLEAKTPVHIFLEPPREKVAEADSPARGPAGAPIEMIEFSDFECPFCLRANPTVQQVLATYGDRIRFVYRNFPLPSHPDALPAAEAAQCANEQGKFWPYHDRLFANSGKLSDADLKQAATDLGLDRPRFDACLGSHKFKDRIDADIRDGNAAGVNGTPAFFINGRMINGAQPFEAFKRVIDEELQLKRGR